jgi:uncharacterized iron-regulated membrane protein
MHTIRHRILRRIHLWLALPLALFLIVLGLTGSVISWMHELDVFLNPELLQVTTDNSETQQTPSTLLARLNNLPGYANPYMLELPEKKNDVLIAWYKVPKKEWVRQVMVNPYSGAIIGERNWGEIGLSRPLFMPTLFHLHRNLLLGETGKIIVSINGILLMIIALSGVYLWWPAWRLKAWRHAITVSRLGSWKHFNFRLHRTAGFYAAPVFLMLAVTGIYLNKPQWIMPIVTIFTQPIMVKMVEKNPDRESAQTLSLEEIVSIAQQQFPLARISRITLPKASNASYEIRLHQPGELRQRTGATRVSINEHGTIIKIQDPLQARKWDLISSYFFPLHSGEIVGITGKLFISLFGLMPLLFAVSGTLIWLKRK